MGRDKASLRLPPPAGVGPTSHSGELPDHTPDGGPTLAARTASILAAACDPAVEVGPGHTVLRAVQESRPGSGPLTAVVAGWEALGRGGWDGPVIVLATDLPNLTAAMVTWLARRPGSRSVVPVASGRVQPLCARYSPADLDVAKQLVQHGRRAMTALLEATDPELVAESEWADLVGGSDVLADVDTPDDLGRMNRP